MPYRVMIETIAFGRVYSPQVLPPPMQRVIEVATKILSRNIYQPRDVTLQSSKSTRDQKKRNDFAESDKESVDDISSISSSSSISNEESLYESERRKSNRKEKGSVQEDSPKETKDDKKSPPKADQNTQSNVEDLAEHFRRLELQLSEREHREPRLQSPRSSIYCFMCGRSGHGIRDCPDSKYFIAQGIAIRR